MGKQSDKLAGQFVVIDGPHGVGKSTQATIPAEYLRADGLEMPLVRGPGGPAMCDRIWQTLLDGAHAETADECKLMLCMASQAQLAAKIIRPALAAGQCVLRDYYISSTTAYPGATGAVRPLAHAEQAEVPEALARRFDPMQFAGIIEQLAEYEQLLWRNVNQKTVWDNAGITCVAAAELRL